MPVVRGTRFAALPFCKRYTESLRGALVSEDTEVMLQAMRKLGIACDVRDGGTTVEIRGGGGSVWVAGFVRRGVAVESDAGVGGGGAKKVGGEGVYGAVAPNILRDDFTLGEPEGGHEFVGRGWGFAGSWVFGGARSRSRGGRCAARSA